MKSTIKKTIITAISILIIAFPVVSAHADSAAIDRAVKNAMSELFKNSATAKKLAPLAKGILIFPNVIKAGIVVGGQFGEGALIKKDITVGYYTTVAASYGLQLGAQAFGYAMFFMTDEALEYLDKSTGWEVGVGPNVVVINEAVARSLTTSTAQDSIYAFFFNQKGLMAGLGLQGSKITKFNPDN